MPRHDLEERVYRAEFASGLLELFVGTGLICVGLAWLADLVALGAVAPALLALLWPGVRNRWIAPRAGRVTFRPERRRRERSALVGLLGIGAVALAVVGLVLAVRDGGSSLSAELVRGLPAALLGVGAVVAGAMFGLPRISWYAVLLFAGAVVAIALPLDPGWVLLGAGTILAGAGAVLLVRFLRANPVVRAE
jgi:hypothetical protein